MTAQLRALFPKLDGSNYTVTSARTPVYNCIAWAAHEDDRWWWPVGDYWPPGADRKLHVDSFVDAYASLGYVQCADGSVEPGYEKIAIYAKPNGSPQHAARQLDNGRWTSKLGKLEDIEHTLDCIESLAYGKAVAFVKRSKE